MEHPFFRRIALCCGLAIVLASPSTLAQTLFEQRLDKQDWPANVNGAAILNIPVLTEMMNLYFDNQPAKLRIKYPGGDAGNQWARELADWLVSLGLSSSDLELAPGSGYTDAVVLEVLKPRNGN